MTPAKKFDNTEAKGAVTLLGTNLDSVGLESSCEEAEAFSKVILSSHLTYPYCPLIIVRENNIRRL